MALTKETVYTSDKSEEVFAPQESGDLTVNQGNITHILSRLTDMYSDPVLASARETISNALDATMRMPADQRKPVDVSVGSFDTTFTVRDYGVGMTTAQVKENFMSYGASTKSSDFGAVGSYGLGSKSPLAYTSEFTVTTTRDGVTTAFKMSNTSAGFKYDILYIRETGRESGTVVAIPMRPDDTNRFLTVAQSYQRYAFDLPIVVNSETSTEPEFLEVGEIVLDEDSNTVGRVWIALESALNWRGSSLPSLDDGFSFVLSGYVYNVPSRYESRYGYGRRESEVIVELKPGLVDFTSSRDDIAKTERSDELVRHITNKLSSDSFWVSATERILNSELVSFVKKYKHFIAQRNPKVTELVTAPLGKKIADLNPAKQTNDALIYSYGWSRSNLNPTLNYVGNGSPKIADIVKDFSAWEATGNLATQYRNHSHSRASYVVITGVDKDNVRKTLGARTKFVRSLIEDGTIEREGALIFRDTKLSTEAAEMEELMGVKYYTHTEVVEIASAATTPAPKGPSEFVLHATKYSRKEGAEGVEFDDLQVFAAEDPLIVLSTRGGLVDGLHAYLENREIIEEDTPIYLLDELQLRVFNAVKDTATLYLHAGESPAVRSVAALEGLKGATRISAEQRSVHLKAKSDDELIAIAFARYARHRYYGAAEDQSFLTTILTAVLQREFVMGNDEWRDARQEPADAAMEVLRKRLDPDVLARVEGVTSSMHTLVRAAEANEDASMEALVDAVIALPNGLG